MINQTLNNSQHDKMARGDKCCCCKCDKHIAISIVGLSLCFWELILSSVYNFLLIGFGFSVIGIICSGLYLHFNIKDLKTRKLEQNNDDREN